MLNMQPEKCIICGKTTKYICRDIFRLKTSYSGTPINVIIERISRSAVDVFSESNETYSCQECIIKIEEYDAAYTKAKDLEHELVNILIKSGEEPDFPQIDYTKFIFRKQTKESITDVMQFKYSPSAKKREIFRPIKTELETEEMYYEECDNLADEYQVTAGNFSENSEELDIKDDTCDYISVGGEDNNGAVEKKNESETNLSQWHECVSCGQAFGTKRKLNLHIKEHQFKPKCEICDKTFKNQMLLGIHLQTHQGKSELECTDCSRMFSSKGALIKHRRIHSGEYIYQCEQCGKQFIHDSSMRMHKLIHQDIREKVCTVCNRAFRSTQHLNRHLRTHTGEKPYYCNKCGKKFAQKYNMMTHYSKVHRLPVRKRKFMCSHCPETFSQRPKLSEHIQIVHGGNDDRAPTVQTIEETNYDECFYPREYYDAISNAQ